MLVPAVNRRIVRVIGLESGLLPGDRDLIGLLIGTSGHYRDIGIWSR